MGLTLEFLIGNDKRIIKAVQKLKNEIFDEIDCIAKKADFSIHLTPNDLNTLSLTASKFNQQKTKTLREYLQVIVNKKGFGLFKVDNSWVEYFAVIKTDKVEELAKEWFIELQKQYPNEVLKLTNDGIKAIKDLVDLCKFANAQGKNVYHFWCL